MTARPPANTNARARCDSGIWLLVTGLVLLSACEDSNRSKEPVSQSASKPLPADQWLGVWRGPEGTSLELSAVAGRFRITIRNLDGPRTFDAFASDTGITFIRDSVSETVRAGSGADTGMKWLAEKPNCLVVKYGEGYCRE